MLQSSDASTPPRTGSVEPFKRADGSTYYRARGAPNTSGEALHAGLPALGYASRRVSTTNVPPAVITVVADVLGGHYYNHRIINTVFVESGAPGEPPEARNCAERCQAWLKRANADADVNALEVLGGALRDFMEQDIEHSFRAKHVAENRDRINKILSKYGLRYEQGGHVRGHLSATPSRTFEDLLRCHDYTTVDDEFRRAMQSIDTEPAAALTASCATLEAICLVYIQDEGLPQPAKKTLGELWPVVKASLGFDPKSVADDDLKEILGGMASVVDGIAAFRTHAGSAHGRERKAYKPRPRHARLRRARGPHARLVRH
jgi:Abortive infection C-terminus